MCSAISPKVCECANDDVCVCMEEALHRVSLDLIGNIQLAVSQFSLEISHSVFVRWYSCGFINFTIVGYSSAYCLAYFSFVKMHTSCTVSFLFILDHTIYL